MKKTDICKHCGKRHTNKYVGGGVDNDKVLEVCWNCARTEEMLLTTVEAINRSQPLNGNRRVIYDLSYKIREEKN